jgi:hypothetical protein
MADEDYSQQKNLRITNYGDSNEHADKLYNYKKYKYRIRNQNLRAFRQKIQTYIIL